jgi:predicted mannosyl-3-phosphoglycerate phosphatase (HAD superfamily)
MQMKFQICQNFPQYNSSFLAHAQEKLQKCASKCAIKTHASTKENIIQYTGMGKSRFIVVSTRNTEFILVLFICIICLVVVVIIIIIIIITIIVIISYPYL